MKGLVTCSCLLLSVATSVPAQEVSDEELVYEGNNYPLYPVILKERPGIPSPLVSADGAEYVIGLTEDGGYTIFTITVENGDDLNYKKNIWYAKGRQLEVDTADFPTLAATGLHSIDELHQTRTITGRSVDEITRIGRPEQYSGVGFLALDEDILSVLEGDNKLVKRMNLTHPELAKPLFHVFNVIIGVMSESGYRKRGNAQSIVYNDRIVNLKFWGSKGWQESIFDDEILGYWEIEMWRDLDQDELTLLSQQYSDLSEKARVHLIRQLLYIHTGEMVPFYITRYGFYEGHTGYRADPITIASIFGLRTIQDINRVFGTNLQAALSNHHTSEDTLHSTPDNGE
jgi:hypothetical protein